MSVKLCDQLLADLCPPALGQPNTLSLEHQAWSVLAEVEEATRDSGSPLRSIEFQQEGSLADSLDLSVSARMLVRQRRSAVAFDGNSGLSRQQLYRMLGTLVPELTPTLWHARFGAQTWRYLHWEAGAVGPLLYLEAEALRLSATGMGCFFDQGAHDLLGLKGGRFRMLYGTAIGRAIHDTRIQTLPAYQSPGVNDGDRSMCIPLRHISFNFNYRVLQ